MRLLLVYLLDELRFVIWNSLTIYPVRLLDVDLLIVIHPCHLTLVDCRLRRGGLAVARHATPRIQ